jgi:hypothetical protein
MDKPNEKASENQDLHHDISIWLDEYDDIFSDFDSRPYSERVLSDDFIGEVKKVSGENEFNVNELKLLLSEKARNKEVEAIITKRLHAYFRKNFSQLAQIKRKTILKGLLLFGMGVVLMVLATYISTYRQGKLGLNLLFVILEPAGWFMVWTSFDELFYSFQKRKMELEFYTKMAKTRIVFVNIKSAT